MQKIHFSVFIDAPKEKVWHTMLDDEPYRKWTEAFAKGSHYVGNWSKGSKILFLAPDDQGKMGGMVGRIRENKRYEFVSIEHMGIVQDGVEDTTSEEVKKWAPALENYTFTEKDGGTEIAIEMDEVVEAGSVDPFRRRLAEMFQVILSLLSAACKRVETAECAELSQRPGVPRPQRPRFLSQWPPCFW